MRILYSKYFPALQKQLYAMVAQVLERGEQMLILVPAQASAMVERGILRGCGIPGFIDLEVLSFEKLTERAGDLAGGRAVDMMDGAGFAMLAKLAMGRSAEKLTMLDAHDPTLHMQVAELVASLKSEQITPERLREAAAQTPGGTGRKLSDIAEVYATMQELAGDALRDGRDMEAAAAAKFADMPYIREKHIVLFGFDMLPVLRMQTVCALAGAARSLTVLAEAAQEDVLQKQWENMIRLQQLAERQGLQVRLQEIRSGRKGEVGHLFENLYAYPYTIWEEQPREISLCCATDRMAEVRQAAAEILQYTCRKGYRMEDIGVLVGNTADYAREIQEVFTGAEIPFFLQSKRSLQKSSLWAWMQPLLAMLCRKQWRIQDAYGYLKSGFVCERSEADALIRWCREHGIKGYRLQKGLGADVPAELEALREQVFAPVVQMQADMAEKPLYVLLKEHCERLEIARKAEELADKAEAQGLGAESRFLRQAWTALEQILEDSAILGGLPAAEYADALTAGVAASEISVVPPTTDEVLIGDGVHAIWPGKKVLFVLGLNEGMLPLVPDTAGLVSSAEVQRLRDQLPAFPDKLVFEDQKAYLRKNLTMTHRLHLSYNEQDGQPSYLADRVCKLFPLLEVTTGKQSVLLHRKAALPQLARELRAGKERSAAPGETTAAYFAQERDVLADMLAEVYAERTPEPMSPATARVLYGTPRATVSQLEEYYRCPYKHFMTYGMKPREIEEFGEDHADIGNYVHGLMEEFTRSAEAQELQWDRLDETHIDRILTEVSEKLQQSHNYGIFMEKRHAFMEKRLREEAAYAIKAVSAQLTGTQTRIAVGEAGFGGDILRLPTRYGMLTVRGRIDRVDEAEGEQSEYIRVVDYKTGHKKFHLSEVYCGVGLQLVVYLMAAVNRYRALGKDAKAAGGFYFNIMLPYLEEGDKESKRLAKFRMNGFLLAEEDAVRAMDAGESKLLSMNAAMKDIEAYGDVASGSNCFTEQEMQQIFSYARHMLVQAAEQMYGGRMDPRPLDQAGQLACRYCEYSAVCMYDPQADTTRKRVYGMDKAEAFREMKRRMEEAEHE